MISYVELGSLVCSGKMGRCLLQREMIQIRDFTRVQQMCVANSSFCYQVPITQYLISAITIFTFDATPTVDDGEDSAMFVKHRDDETHQARSSVASSRGGIYTYANKLYSSIVPLSLSTVINKHS